MNRTATYPNGTETGAQTVTLNNGAVIYAYQNADVSKAGNITINASTSGGSGVSLGGTIKTNADVTITSYGSITQPTDGTKIYGNDISLTSSNSYIGTSSKYLAVDTNYESSGGVLTAYTNSGSIYITETAEDLSLYEANADNDNTGSVGNVYITSAGSILDGNSGSENPNIIGNIVTLTAVVGSNATIGTMSEDLNVYSSKTSENALTAQAYKDINITQTSGNLYLGFASNAGRGDVKLTSAGGIYDSLSGENPNIYAKGIDLTSTTGSIGTTGTGDIDIDSNYGSSSGGVLEADTHLGNGNIYIEEKVGDLHLYEVWSGGEYIQLTAPGNITDDRSGSDSNGNVYGKNIYLISTSGSIGTIDDDLDVCVNYNTTGGYLQAAASNTTNGYINISQVTVTNLPLYEVWSGGDVKLTAYGNITDARPGSDSNGNVYAKNIYLISTSGSIGTIDDDLDVCVNYNTTGGNLHVAASNSTNGYINISQVTVADLPLFEVYSGGDVKLTAYGNITDARENEIYGNVYGESIELISTTGKIGDTGTDQVYGDKDLDVYVNYYTTEGKLSATASNTTNGYINISQESGDLPLLVVWSGLNVKLTAPGNITDAGENETYCNIYGKSIELTSNGTIGASGDGDLDIDSNYYTSEGTVTITSSGSIYLEETSGALYINQINAGTGDVYITSAGSILDGNSGNENPNIIAHSIDLTSTTGSIGATDTGDLDIDSNYGSSSGGVLNADTTGGDGVIYLEETTGVLRIGTINAGTGDVYIYASDSSNNANIVDAKDGDGIGYENIIGQDIFLDNYCSHDTDSTIGELNSPLDVNLQDGSLYVAADDLINIEEVDGDLKLNVVSNGGRADIKLKAYGNILDYSTDETYANIYAKSITLESTNGTIGAGTDNSDLDIDSNRNPQSSIGDGKVTITTNGGNVYLTEILNTYNGNNYGELIINSVNAGTGDVYITSAGSILDGNTGVSTAKITGDQLTLTAGENYNIGGSGTNEELEIDSGSSGVSATAWTSSATSGSIYLKEVGTNPKITVTGNTIKAVNAIELEADWEIENHGGTIETTAASSSITLKTDNTQLYDVSSSSNEDIKVGTGGTLKILNASNQAMSIGGGSTDHIITTDEITTFRSDNIEFGDTTNTSNIDVYTVNLTNRNSDGTGLANAIFNASGNITDDMDDNDANIIANNITLTSTAGTIGTSTSDYLEISATGVLNANTSTGNGSIYLKEVSDDLNISDVNAGSGDVYITAAGDILDGDSSDDPSSTADITGADITLTSAGAIGASGNYLEINTGSTGILNANTSTGNGSIYIKETSDNLNVSDVNAGSGDVYLIAAGDILDGNAQDTACVTGDYISLTAGTDSNIGADSTDEGILEIDSGSGGLNATADTGSIFIKEVGTNPTIIVNSVQAQDEIYLRADWKLQNYTSTAGSTIETTASNSKITLVTDDTKLYDEANTRGGIISSGTNGTLVIGRKTAGDIYFGYDGYDNVNHPGSNETTYITTGTGHNEKGTIDSNIQTILLEPLPGSKGIYGDVSGLNVIAYENYDFLNHPILLSQGKTLYLVRKSVDGSLYLGGNLTSSDPGVVNQAEIDNITADNIQFGNVAVPTGPNSYYDTTKIYLYDPDFSQTSSTNGPSNIVLSTSGSIVDGDNSVENRMIAHDITLNAALLKDQSPGNGNGSGNNGSIGEIILYPNSYEAIELYLLNDGVDNGKLNATAANDIAIWKQNLQADSNYNLHLGLVESRGSSILLFNSQFQTVTDPPTTKECKIIDENGSTNNLIAKNNIKVTSWYLYNDDPINYDGDIGSSGDLIEINSANGDTGSLIAYSEHVYIEETAGNLSINNIRNIGLDPMYCHEVVLKANDPDGADILDSDPNNDAVNNIVSLKITLEALHGSIGSGSIGETGDLDITTYTEGNSVELSAQAGTATEHEHTAEIINISSIDSPIYLSEVTGNNNTDAYINAVGDTASIYYGSGDYAIQANDITLLTDAQIGSEERTVKIVLLDDDSSNPGKITATADAEILLQSDGDMSLNEIALTKGSGPTAISLTALNNGSILDGRGTESPPAQNIEAVSTQLKIDLIADTDIGSSSKPIVLNYTNSQSDESKYTKTHSGGDTYLDNIYTGEYLRIKNSEAGGNYNLSATCSLELWGTDTLPAIKSDGIVTIDSAGNIIDYDVRLPGYYGYTLIQADTIDLTASHSIGDSDNNIHIKSYTTDGTITFDATAGSINTGNIYVHSTSNLNLGFVESTYSGVINITANGNIVLTDTVISHTGTSSYGDIYLTATNGSITNNTEDTVINVEGNDLYFTANTIGGGDPADPIEVKKHDNSGDNGSVSCNGSSCTTSEVSEN